MRECDLRRRYINLGVACDEDECVFWTQLGLSGEPQCAIKYFRLLDGDDSELVRWLMSLKDEQVAQMLGMEPPTPPKR